MGIDSRGGRDAWRASGLHVVVEAGSSIVSLGKMDITL
jgi:hypothetical protein